MALYGWLVGMGQDRENETEFMTISYWESVEDMASFAGKIPHAFITWSEMRILIELPKEVQILRIRKSHGRTG